MSCCCSTPPPGPCLVIQMPQDYSPLGFPKAGSRIRCLTIAPSGDVDGRVLGAPILMVAGGEGHCIQQVQLPELCL